MPAVYNPQRSEGRTTRETELLSTKEYNNALYSGFTALNGRFVIKTEKFCEEIADLRKRIVDYNLNGNEGLDDSDIEFLRDEVDESDSDIEFEALMPKPAQVVKTEDADVSAEIDNLNDAQNDHVSSSQKQLNATGNTDPGQTEATNEVVGEAAVDVVTESNDSGQNDAANENVVEKTADVLSGSIAFETNDVNDYNFRDFNATIRAPIVNVLTAWNTSYPFNTDIYDKRFVGVLLKEIFNNQYADGQLDDQRLALLKRLFEIRVQNNKNRLEQFDAIVSEKCDRAMNKKNRRTSS